MPRRTRQAHPVEHDLAGLLLVLDCDGDPAQVVEHRDEVHRVMTALRQVPELQRRALVLAAMFGRTANEVSEIEGVPLGTAKTRIRAGLIKLRDRVGGDPRAGSPMSAGRVGCDEMEALAPELALGTLSGAERADAVGHLAECADCQQRVSELALAADSILLLAPTDAPSAELEARVLARPSAIEPASPAGDLGSRAVAPCSPAA